MCIRDRGKTARALRMLGIDTIYLRHPSRDKLQELALKENRIILTRAHDINLKNKVLILEDVPYDEHIKFLLKKFKLKIKPLTRCLECNSLLCTVDKSFVKGKVPFFVYQTFQKFAYCPYCKKIYWQGTHYQAMQRKIKEWLIR